MKGVNIYEEASRCLLCQDAPCTKACQHGDPARAIRAIRFDNAKLAARWIADCTDADLERAEQACIHYGWPIRIKEMLRAVSPDDVAATYPSLDVEFCGLHCENPFFLASSAVCTAKLRPSVQPMTPLSSACEASPTSMRTLPSSPALRAMSCIFFTCGQVASMSLRPFFPASA